jgi:hypothetical protein
MKPVVTGIMSNLDKPGHLIILDADESATHLQPNVIHIYGRLTKTQPPKPLKPVRIVLSWEIFLKISATAQPVKHTKHTKSSDFTFA